MEIVEFRTSLSGQIGIQLVEALADAFEIAGNMVLGVVAEMLDKERLGLFIRKHDLYEPNGANQPRGFLCRLNLNG